MSTTYDRRQFLVRAGLVGASGLVIGTGAFRPAAAADDALAPFVHGVASGDPTASTVLLWTRVTPDGAAPDAIEVAWEIASDPAFVTVVDRGTTTATAAEDFTVNVRATGLAPFAYHYYRFRALGRVSIVGRTKTAPAPGQTVDRLRLGLVSCANYEGGYFNAYARLAERNDMDAILCAGDYLYEYGPGEYGPGAAIGRTVEPPNEMATLTDYRGRFAHYRLDPDLRRLHQLYPWIVTWDDHETTNDSWRGGAENHNPDDPAAAEAGIDWETRKRSAWKAYREWMPVDIDAADLDAPIVLYRSLPYGDLADVVVMDTRIEGRDEQLFEVLEPGITETAIDAEERRLISPTQQAFVEDALTQSQASWKIVLQQVMLMQWRIPALPAGLAGNDIPLPLLTAGGNSVNGDAWDGYAAERRRLFTHLRNDDITDVVVLTGDIHTTWAAELTEDPLDLLGYDPTGLNPLVPRNLGVEFVTPSITSDNFDEIINDLGVPPEATIALVRALEATTMVTNPHIKSVNLDRHGYGIVDVTATRTTFDVFFVDQFTPNDDESFHQSWFVDKSGPGQVGHRLTRAAVPTASRTETPVAPAALPEVIEVVGAPDGPPVAGPVAGSVPAVAGGSGALPATGGTNHIVLGAAAAAVGTVIARRNLRRPAQD